MKDMASACTESASLSMERMSVHPKHFDSKAISQSWLSRRKPRFTSDNVPLLLAASQSLQRDEFCSDDEEANNESALELRACVKASVPPPQPDIVFKDIPIGAGDTLINLALRYNCSISDLKRYNKLANNNDLYALNILRVPVLRHGLIGDLIEEENVERISALNSSKNQTTVAVQNGDCLKYSECESTTCGSNIHIDDETTGDNHCLIHSASDYTHARLKYNHQARDHEQVAKMFREADVAVQNIASTLPEITADVDEESEVLNMIDEAATKHRGHDSSVTWCNGKISMRLIVIVCVALLLALGLLIRLLWF